MTVPVAICPVRLPFRCETPKFPAGPVSPHLVNQDCKRWKVEEHMGLCLISGIGGKAFADDAVPVWAELAIKESLDVAGDVVLVLVLAHRGGCLLQGISEQLAALLGVSLDLLSLRHLFLQTRLVSGTPQFCSLLSQ